MKVIDTSIWLELLSDGPLANIADEALKDPSQILVPTMVLLDVYKWMYRERGEDRADQTVAWMMLSRIEPLDTATSVRAAQLCTTWSTTRR